MSNLKPLSRLYGQGNQNHNQPEFNFAAQLSSFFNDKSNPNSINKKTSFLENPNNEIERRK
jgi:hypothetical protein